MTVSKVHSRCGIVVSEAKLGNEKACLYCTAPGVMIRSLHVLTVCTPTLPPTVHNDAMCKDLRFGLQ